MHCRSLNVADSCQAYPAYAIALQKSGLLDYSLLRGEGRGSFVLFFTLDGTRKEANVTATEIRECAIILRCLREQLRTVVA